jgi:DNA ligase 1
VTATSPVTLLTELVEVSNGVAATSSRLAKTALIAAFLRRVEPDEVETAIAFLSGETRQGKLTVGYAALQKAAAQGSQQHSLSILDVDAAFERLKTSRAKARRRNARSY